MNRRGQAVAKPAGGSSGRPVRRVFPGTGKVGKKCLLSQPKTYPPFVAALGGAPPRFWRASQGVYEAGEVIILATQAAAKATVAVSSGSSGQMVLRARRRGPKGAPLTARRAFVPPPPTPGPKWPAFAGTALR